MTHTLFISDLHLSEDQPHLTTLFKHFMEHIAPQAKALYILGDFFNLWISDHEQTAWTQAIQQTLHTLSTSGVPVYLMVGNRDFTLGPLFAAQSGCTLIPDPTVISIAAQRVVLCHGDTLCTDDIAYMRYRRIVRSNTAGWLIQHAPIGLIRWLGHTIRKRSAARHAARPNSDPIAAIHEPTAAALCAQHHATHLLHGHTHVAGTHPLTGPDAQYQRIVLNAWDEQGHYLQWDDDGTYRLMSFDV